MSTEKIYGLGGIIYDDLILEGANLSLNATLGAEKVIDGTFDVAALGDWVLGAGWSDGTGKAAKAADGVGTLTQAVAISAVVGTTYKIVYQVLDVTVDGVTLTYGGISDATKLANGTYTFYVTAATTGSLILTPSSNGSRFSIDNVSVKALTDATGDLTVDGNLEVRSPATFINTLNTNKELNVGNGLNILSGQVLSPVGSVTAPSWSFVNAPTTGIFYSGGNLIFTVGGAQCAYVDELILATPEVINLGWYNDIYLRREGIGVAAFRNGTNIQTLRIYETYTDATNYERYAFIPGSNQLEIKAETLGTGSDDLDIAITPAGVGLVKFGTYAAITTEVNAGFVTIKDSSGNLRKLAVVA